MSRLYSYVVQHDHGFAPNPFMGVCTLANCKPQIRKAANVGDLVIGTGSADIHADGHLVYWMRVAEIITFDEYWEAPRFSRKKPVMNGSLMQRYGITSIILVPMAHISNSILSTAKRTGALAFPIAHVILKRPQGC
nr:hypothetical protein [Frigidibacter mobilis]